MRAVLVALLWFCMLTPASGFTPAWDPLPFRPKIGRCTPIQVLPSDQPGENGRGNRPQDRLLTIDFGTYLNDHLDVSPATPTDLVEDIEVCLLGPAGAVECLPLAVGGLCSGSPDNRLPTGCGWDPGDLATALNPLPLATVGRGGAAAPHTTRVFRNTDPPEPLDWMNDTTDVVFLRVRMKATSGYPDDSTETALRYGGFCVVPTVIASKTDVEAPVEFPSRGDGQPAGPGFVLIGQLAGGANPLAGFGYSAADLCLLGSRAGYVGWATPNMAGQRYGADSDADEVPDRREGMVDTDGDGVPDAFDPDDDDDGVPTSLELQYFPGSPPQPVDILGDGTPMHLRPDFAYSNLENDGDATGVNDAAEVNVPPDSDGDGIPNDVETVEVRTNPYAPDTDGDSVPDPVEAVNLVEGFRDMDLDGIPDARDADDDGDGVQTVLELVGAGSRRSDGTYGPPDTDSDGLPDYLDADDGLPLPPAVRPIAAATGPTLKPFSTCVSERAAAFGLEATALLAAWQEDKVMAGLAPDRKEGVALSSNGLSACDGQPCPVHISVFPRTGAMTGGQGFLHAGVDHWNKLDFALSSARNHWSTGSAASTLMSDIGHEFFHTFQGAWSRYDVEQDQPVSDSLFDRQSDWREPTANWAPFACVRAGDFAQRVSTLDPASPGEIVNQLLDAESADVLASLEEWTSVPPEERVPENRCVSRWKMEDEAPSAADPGRIARVNSGRPMGLFQYVANLTELGPLTTQWYAGAPFWRYVVEQWARGQGDTLFPPFGCARRVIAIAKIAAS